MIESRMGSGQAQAAASDLPDQVDHEQHADLLSKFGIDPRELLGGGGSQPHSRPAEGPHLSVPSQLVGWPQSTRAMRT